MNFLNKIHKALPKIKQNPDKLDFNKIMTINSSKDINHYNNEKTGHILGQNICNLCLAKA